MRFPSRAREEERSVGREARARSSQEDEQRTDGRARPPSSISLALFCSALFCSPLLSSPCLSSWLPPAPLAICLRSTPLLPASPPHHATVDPALKVVDKTQPLATIAAALDNAGFPVYCIDSQVKTQQIYLSVCADKGPDGTWTWKLASTDDFGTCTQRSVGFGRGTVGESSGAKRIRVAQREAVTSRCCALFVMCSACLCS